MARSNVRREWHLRDPPAGVAGRRRARAVAESVADEYEKQGARAVVLGGSWARGDAHRESDIDLWVFGLRAGDDVLWRPPFVVTVKKTSERSERRKLARPPHVGGSVPGWRAARPLRDPDGVAHRLKTAARAFRWTAISRRCDRWVAEQMVGWAEEAVKLVRGLATGQDATAAVQRDLLAEHLGFVMAIHRRMFWDSENEFWERIGRVVGGPWARAQRFALGIPGNRLEPSCRAALRLYVLTARETWSTLDVPQREIVAHTCRVVGPPFA